MVEGLGVSQIFALLPTYLRQMGVAEQDRLAFIGIFSALIFVVGMPLVPLWGAWADKYSRKVVIIRSALVEAVVFAAVALAREPWQLAVAMLLIGFQLGNTGIMLAGIRDVTPRHRLGTAIALFGASGAVGFAIGPALAGILIDGFGWALSPVFAFSALLSVGTALLVAFGSREVRPEVVPTGRIVDLAYASLRGVLTDRATRRIFLIFGISFVAIQMSRPYIPVLVEGITGLGPGLASAIGLVAGTAALVGALVSPLGGVIGDRIGFRPVLVAALSGAGVVLFLMPLVASVGIARAARGRAGRGDRHRQLDGLRPACHRAPAGTTVGGAQPGLPAALRRGDDRSGGGRRGRVGERDRRPVRRRWLRLPVRGADDRAAARPGRRSTAGHRASPSRRAGRRSSRSARPTSRDDEPGKDQRDQRAACQRQRLARLDEPVALTRARRASRPGTSGSRSGRTDPRHRSTRSRRACHPAARTSGRCRGRPGLGLLSFGSTGIATASDARIIWWTRSPPASPIVAMTAARMTAGRARPMIEPTATPTAKTKTARLAISRPRKPKFVNELPGRFRPWSPRRTARRRCPRGR